MTTVHAFCRDAECPKNHISYYKNRKGYRADFVLPHFKNDAIKGTQRLPVAQQNLEVLAMLEKASAYCHTHSSATDVTTLFHDSTGKLCQAAYFSIVAAKQLTFGDIRCTANTLRHSFATAWRDFLAIPTTQLMGVTATQLEAAAAGMMLNSTEAWNSTYDDTTMNRSIHATLALWPRFQAFVKEQHLDKVSEVPWDPVSIDIATLSPSSS